MLSKRGLPEALESQVQSFRAKAAESSLSAPEIEFLLQELSPYKSMLGDKIKEEILWVKNDEGEWNTLKAPRWLCHFIGLHHRVVHILLLWRRDNGEIWPVLQIRSWDTEESPGHLDLSAAGHIIEDEQPAKSASLELFEELGLEISDLQGGSLEEIGSYSFFNKSPETNFYNSEQRICYIGYISSGAIDKITFQDKEVSGLFICPLDEVAKVIAQDSFPTASALTHSFPFMLEWIIHRI